MRLVGAPYLAAGGPDPRERRGLLVSKPLGPLEQAPAGVLELGGLLLVGAAQLVPVGAADLVQRPIGELNDVIWVDADHRLGRVLASGGGIPVAHVQADRSKLSGALADGWLSALLASRIGGERRECGDLGVELFEEAIGGLLARAVGSPHDLAAKMVGHEGEVVVLALPADLVDPDVEEAVQTGGIELVVTDALDDPPDRAVEPGIRLIVVLSVRVASHATGTRSRAD